MWLCIECVWLFYEQFLPVAGSSGFGLAAGGAAGRRSQASGRLFAVDLRDSVILVLILAGFALASLPPPQPIEEHLLDLGEDTRESWEDRAIKDAIPHRYCLC